MKGLIRLEILGADISGTLGQLVEQGTDLRDTAMKDELCALVSVERRDLEKVLALCRKRGDKVRIIRHLGGYWTLRKLLGRPVLLFGLLLMTIVALYVPSRIFFVRVEGNVSVPTGLILEMADRCGIGFGAGRRTVRSEKVKNALLEAVPQLKWAGVNTYGCVAVISVRERDLQNNPPEASDFGHIIALTEGVITQCTALRGSLLCIPGQAVTKGEILISGYTDTGLCIRAEQAKGEIYAMTNRRISVITPANCMQRTETVGEKKKISLLIGKKRINLWKDSGISDGTCGRMYEEYYITLPGGFQLPVALILERYKVCVTSEMTIPEDLLRRVLENVGKGHLAQEMLAGTILDAELTFSEVSGFLTMAGKYRCTEMIGVMQRLQIGEYNGENN